jgi:hypothetical protein
VNARRFPALFIYVGLKVVSRASTATVLQWPTNADARLKDGANDRNVRRRDADVASMNRSAHDHH